MIKSLHSISEAEQYLLRYSPVKLGGESYALGRMLELMNRLGNPQNNLRVIHVAGTSGKTSTSYFVRNMLEASHQRTGLTASPHIESITERVQVDGKPLADETFLLYLNEFLAILAAWHELDMTYFELLTAFSYWVFAKEQVDYAVVEVGLGGLLDATNVIFKQDKVCVLTPIGLDHTQVLGTTLEAIAVQKAGIITPENIVFSAKQDEKVSQVFNRIADSQSAALHYVNAPAMEGSLLPLFQQQNWQLAYCVYQFVCHRDGLPSVAFEALNDAQQTPPGRYERYRVTGKTIILDGAHNPQKLVSLRQAIDNEFHEDVAILAGFVTAPDDKIERCLHELSLFSKTLILTEFTIGQDISARRSVRLDELDDMMQQQNIYATNMSDPEQALQQLLRAAESVCVVTGSLYLVAALRPKLRALAAK